MLMGCGKTNYERYFNLVFKGACEFKQTPTPDGSLQITYKVNLKYPSKDVFQFYNEYLKSTGWAKYSYFGPNQGNWEYIVSYNKDMPDRSKRTWGHWQLLYTWVNNDKKEEASLFLEYGDNYLQEYKGIPKLPLKDVQFVCFKMFKLFELPAPGTYSPPQTVITHPVFPQHVIN